MERGGERKKEGEREGRTERNGRDRGGRWRERKGVTEEDRESRKERVG